MEASGLGFGVGGLANAFPKHHRQAALNKDKWDFKKTFMPSPVNGFAGQSKTNFTAASVVNRGRANEDWRRFIPKGYNVSRK